MQRLGNRFIDTTGNRYGSLLVLEDKRGQGGNPRLVCLCDCGRKTNPIKSQVRNGHTRSCGCKHARKDLTGRKFGYLTVVANGLEDFVLCRCKCGEEVSLARKQVIQGKRSCRTPHKLIGRMIAIDGIKFNLQGWADVLGVSRERARQLKAKGRLEERVRERIGRRRVV